MRISRPTPTNSLRAEVSRGLSTDSLESVGTIEDPGDPLVWTDDADAASFYRIVWYGEGNVILGDTGPFSGRPQGPPDFRTTKKIDHNFGGPDTLRYCTEGGAGIPQASITIYTAADFDIGETDSPIARTQTNDDGRWAAPFFVPMGQDYCIVMDKPNLFGPDVVRLTV